MKINFDEYRDYFLNTANLSNYVGFSEQYDFLSHFLYPPIHNIEAYQELARFVLKHNDACWLMEVPSFGGFHEATKKNVQFIELINHSILTFVMDFNYIWSFESSYNRDVYKYDENDWFECYSCGMDDLENNLFIFLDVLENNWSIRSFVPLFEVKKENVPESLKIEYSL